MEDFQRWKDIQGSIDGTMGVIKGKSQEEERGRGKGIIESI